MPSHQLLHNLSLGPRGRRACSAGTETGLVLLSSRVCHKRGFSRPVVDLLRVHLNSSKKVWDVRAIAALNLVGYRIAGRISMHLDKPPGNNNLNVFLTNDNRF